jgi:hypothetical protein
MNLLISYYENIETVFEHNILKLLLHVLESRYILIITINVIAF